ncbi:response regulator receiver protein [Glaciecola nitratireducens FR1064]|uniref:Response regulator receiver protein n=2 Tax=Brumicola TaxID=3160924 RepID=G4QN32_GLANF|nr:response regulator receiver protein [Glaciecola nitratireducens FR1064]
MLVEDNHSDQVMVERALEDGKIACDLTILPNGQKALESLRDMLLSDSLPDLVLMDINMPVMDGKQTLQEIRADLELKHLPVVMLTTSNREKDVIESYRLGVNAYLTKPVLDSQFIKTIQQLENFWFELVVLPNKIK